MRTQPVSSTTHPARQVLQPIQPPAPGAFSQPFGGAVATVPYAVQSAPDGVVQWTASQPNPMVHYAPPTTVTVHDERATPSTEPVVDFPDAVSEIRTPERLRELTESTRQYINEGITGQSDRELYELANHFSKVAKVAGPYLLRRIITPPPDRPHEIISFNTNGPLFQNSINAVWYVLREAVPADHILLAALRFAGRLVPSPLFAETVLYEGVVVVVKRVFELSLILAWKALADCKPRVAQITRGYFNKFKKLEIVALRALRHDVSIRSGEWREFLEDFMCYWKFAVVLDAGAVGNIADEIDEWLEGFVGAACEARGPLMRSVHSEVEPDALEELYDMLVEGTGFTRV
ncbi:hypothetical protein K523DRAFT_260950, partial [Schizophyllum commune Tattone D]